MNYLPRTDRRSQYQNSSTIRGNSISGQVEISNPSQVQRRQEPRPQRVIISSENIEQFHTEPNLQPDVNSATDLQGIASRRTAMSGALSMGLLSSNTDQLLTILSLNNLPTSEYIKAGLLGVSLLLQVITMLLLLIIGSSGRVTQGRKKRHSRLTTTTMALSFFITVLNVVITGFGGKNFY